MKKLIATSLVVASLLSGAWGQTFDEYLKLRKQYGIRQASSVVATETFVGTKILEVQGTVNGFIGSGSSGILILDNPQGREIYVNALNVPDWLKGNKTHARLLVKATRLSDTSRLEAELLGAATEHQVADYDARQVVTTTIAAPKKNTQRTPPSKTSRGGGRPPSMPGDFPTISGPIGKGPKLSSDVLTVLPAYTAFIQNRNKRLSQSQAQHIAETVLAFSVHYGVDARLIMAIVIVESGFDPGATSRAGAQGLGQLMPGTARGLGVTNSYDTEQNLYGTVRLIRGHIDKYTKSTGDAYEGLVLALAAYNAGSGAVRRHGGVPPYKETQNYIRKVISTYQQLIGK
mgnify:CR=1 FL=1